MITDFKSPGHNVAVQLDGPPFYLESVEEKCNYVNVAANN